MLPFVNPFPGNGYFGWLMETGDGGTSRYTAAIDWGGSRVDSTTVNSDGELVIRYFFEPGTGTFGPFDRLPWTSYEEGQVKEALEVYEDYINVDFVETSDRSQADFILNKVDGPEGVLGFMNPPGTAGAGIAAFNGADGTVGWDRGGLEQGGYGFNTLLHEFGHGLGLAHPHDNGGGSTILPGVSNAGDPGRDNLNQAIYTVMSYVDGWNTHPDGPQNPFDDPDYGWIGTPMAIDIALLQFKYGANEDHNSGNTTYTLPKTNGPGTYWSTIWDTGGTDKIVHTGSTAAVIDLRPASLLLEEGGGGWVSFVDGIHGGFTIAYGVVIENASGGSGDDYLVANRADNALTGNGGADTFVFPEDGGGNDRITDFEDGVDMVDVTELRPLYSKRDISITEDASGTTVHYGMNSIFFEDVDRDDLSAADFILT